MNNQSNPQNDYYVVSTNSNETYTYARLADAHVKAKALAASRGTAITITHYAARVIGSYQLDVVFTAK